MHTGTQSSKREKPQIANFEFQYRNAGFVMCFSVSAAVYIAQKPQHVVQILHKVC